MFRGIDYNYSSKEFKVYYDSELKGITKNEEESVKLYNSFLRPSCPKLKTVHGNWHTFQAKHGIDFKSTNVSTRGLRKIKKELEERRIKALKKNKEILREQNKLRDEFQEDSSDSYDDLFGSDYEEEGDVVIDENENENENENEKENDVEF